VTKPKNDIPLAFLRECLDIDAEAQSELRWRPRPLEHFPDERARASWNARYAGQQAGAHAKGYWLVGLTYGGRRRMLGAHRIVVALTHGFWPEHEVDHRSSHRECQPPVWRRGDGAWRLGAFHRRFVIIIALMAAAPASAQTVTCDAMFQGYRVCQGPDGYRSTETQWQGITTGRDNRGNEWTTSHWNGLETTTVRRRPERWRHGPHRDQRRGVRGDSADGFRNLAGI
jgi:hypothetical protein